MRKAAAERTAPDYGCGPEVSAKRGTRVRVPEEGNSLGALKWMALRASMSSAVSSIGVLKLTADGASIFPQSWSCDAVKDDVFLT
jgi:hypothetical protein